MRRWVLFSVIVIAILVIVGGAAYFIRRSQDPRVVLAWIRDGKGDSVELMKRLQLMRVDIIEPIIEAATDSAAPAQFRCNLIEVLMKTFQRSADERIGKAIQESLGDADAEVRRSAVYCIGLYGDKKLRSALPEQVGDPAPEVRREAYLMLTSDQSDIRTLWKDMEPAAKSKMVAIASKSFKNEQDENLAYLARSVVGRRIAELVEEAVAARQRAELPASLEKLEEALQLDPSNRRAKIAHVRHFLAAGEKKQALQLAEKYDALVRIPRLASPPIIDGDPSDDVWKSAFHGKDFFRTGAGWASKRSEGLSEFYIGRVGGTIYVAGIGLEENLDLLKVTHAAADSRVWKDDSIEVLLDPSADGTKCFRFTVNPQNVLLDQLLREQQWNSDCEHAAGVYKERAYWSCELAIPISKLSEKGVTSDDIWGFNVVRRRIGSGPEETIWRPTFGWIQYYDRFPIAVFEP